MHICLELNKPFIYLYLNTVGKCTVNCNQFLLCKFAVDQLTARTKSGDWRQLHRLLWLHLLRYSNLLWLCSWLQVGHRQKDKSCGQYGSITMLFIFKIDWQKAWAHKHALLTHILLECRGVLRYEMKLTGN